MTAVGAGARGALVDRRPLTQLVREWAWAPWAVGVMIGLRVIAVIGLRPYIYVDSGEYDRVDFSGRWRRPWATPWLYSLVPGDEHRIVVAQALIGALCWSVLALSAAAWCRTGRVRIGLVVAILALGATTSVTNWDAAKLSESLALSLTVLLVAVWLNFVRRPVAATACWVALATFPWLFVRQSLMPTAWIMAMATVVAAVVATRRGGPWRILGGLAIALVVLASLASYSYSRNQEVVRENLTAIVADRIAPDPGRLAWFEARGMPTPASGDLGFEALKADAAFSAWVSGDGRTTYARFLASHPWYSLTEPLDDLVGQRHSYADQPSPQSTMLSPAEAYASSRPVIPELLEQALFQPGATGTMISGIGLVVGWSIARRSWRELRWLIPLAVVGISLASLVVAWHGAVPELGRLAIVGAVGLRIGLLLQGAALVDGEVATWHRRRP